MARPVLWTLGAVLILFLVAPIAIVVLTSLNPSPYMEFPPAALSLRWYQNFLASPHWTGPALLSLRVAALVSVLSTVFGTMAAIGIVRGRFPGRQILEVFLLSPMVVPIVVLALGLYFLFSATHLLNSPLALVLGHTIVAMPIVIILVRAGLRTTDPAAELAARSLGANFWGALWHVTLPALRGSIAAAAVFSFLISFDEVVVAVFVGGPDATTLPKRMWESIRFEIDPTLTAISSLLTLLVIVLLLGAEGARRVVAQGRNSRVG